MGWRSLVLDIVSVISERCNREVLDHKGSR